MAWKRLGEPDRTKPPFDGGHVLVADKIAVSEARYHQDRDGWWLAQTDPTDVFDGQIYPTHWQPMPNPPASIKARAESQ